MRVRGPLLSQAAHGWLGRTTYGKRNYNQSGWIEQKWVVSNPYPIALLPFIRVANRLPFFNTTPGYHVPAFGLRAYPAFISQYYSPLGWVYQERRTWHGMQPTIGRPPIHANTQTIYQIARRNLFSNAIIAWQGFNEATKDIYRKQKYPVHSSGYDRFITMYSKTQALPSVEQGYILNEDGSIIKTEGNDLIVQEP